MALTKAEIAKMEKENGLGRIYAVIKNSVGYQKKGIPDVLHLEFSHTRNNSNIGADGIWGVFEVLRREFSVLTGNMRTFGGNSWYFEESGQGLVWVAFDVRDWVKVRGRLGELGIPWRFAAGDWAVKKYGVGSVDLGQISPEGKSIVSMDAYVSPVG